MGVINAVSVVFGKEIMTSPQTDAPSMTDIFPSQ
jgi:hypothetical protein